MSTLVYGGVGARGAPAHVLAPIRGLAGRRARAVWYLRTGGAAGCDSAWEAGARAAGGSGDVVRACDELPGAALDVAAAHHPAWDRCDERTRQLLARNVLVVLGRDLASPAAALLYWRPEHLARGGTLHALRVAEAHGVPVENVAFGSGLFDRMLLAGRASGPINEPLTSGNLTR